MEKEDPVFLLKQLIKVKETECAIEGKLLKDHFRLTFESLRPINIIKDTLKDAISSPELKENLVNKTIGFVTGLIAKKVLIGKTHNPLTKILANLFETVVANKVSKNADGIRSIGNILLNKLINPQNKP